MFTDSKYNETCIKIKHLPKDVYLKIATDITGQLPYNFDFKHCTYKSTFDLKLTPNPVEFKYTPNNHDFFRIFYLSRKYYIYHIQIKDLVHYLNCNLDAQRRYVCLPINYYNCHIMKGHIGSVVFDLVKNEIIILESNGRHPIDFIDRLFNILVREINRYDKTFKFIPLHKWLLSKRNINYSSICATGNLFLLFKLLEKGDKSLLDNYLENLSYNDIVSHLEKFIDEKFDYLIG